MEQLGIRVGSITGPETLDEHVEARPFTIPLRRGSHDIHRLSVRRVSVGSRPTSFDGTLTEL